MKNLNAIRTKRGSNSYWRKREETIWAFGIHGVFNEDRMPFSTLQRRLETCSSASNYLVKNAIKNGNQVARIYQNLGYHYGSHAIIGRIGFNPLTGSSTADITSIAFFD